MLKENKKLDIDYILKDLDKYKPKRRGWVWREHLENLEMGPLNIKTVQNLKEECRATII